MTGVSLTSVHHLSLQRMDKETTTGNNKKSTAKGYEGNLKLVRRRGGEALREERGGGVVCLINSNERERVNKFGCCCLFSPARIEGVGNLDLCFGKEKGV